MANALVVELDTDYSPADDLRLPVRLDQAADFKPVYCK